MVDQIDPFDQRLALVAARQHGVVTLGQLVALGISKAAISKRVAGGHLHRLHRGVYAVGHPGVSREGRWMAAVLACGEGAVLSHRGAAALWGWLPEPRGPVDVSTSARSGRSQRAGIRLHRCRSLSGQATTRRAGIPVTTPARTLTDLRKAVPAWQWRKAVRQAELTGLETELTTDGTRSDLERDFLRFCRRQGLPRPQVNVRIEPWTADFLWAEQRVVVETDGYAYHRGQIAFEDDRARELGLRARGYDVIRLAGRQLREEAELVTALLVEALGSAGSGAS